MSRPVRRVVKKVKKVDTVQFGAWENYERHAAELRDLGASETDLQPLRKAAERIEQAERIERELAAEQTDLTKLTGPYQCACGLEIAPPTNAARRWALAAVTRLTAGGKIDPGVGFAMVLGSALHILQMWGAGLKQQVSRLICLSGQLEEAAPQFADEIISTGTLDESASDYMFLMGVTSPADAKKNALAAARRELNRLRATHGTSTPSPAPARSSASPGKITGTGSLRK